MQFDIEAYLNGELDAAARQKFEAELARNAGLRAEVDAMRPLMRDLQHFNVESRVKTAINNRARRRRAKKIAFALSLGVGVFGGFLWWKYFQTGQETEKVLPRTESPKNENQPGKPVFEQENAPSQPEIPQKGIFQKEKQPIASREKPPKNQPNYRNLPAENIGDASDIALADRFLADFSPTPFLDSPTFNDRSARGDFDEYIAAVDAIEPERGVVEDRFVLVKSAALLRLHRPAEAMVGLFQLQQENSKEGQEAGFLMAIGFLMEGKKDSATVILQKTIDDSAHPRAVIAKKMLDSIE